ncbi:MAG TPA: DUF3592 domain-containing protein, partial [Candidatus Ozemobacteraceae bacterium]|nr:DUF3592 domain-containing protein [Candidatus Ozemobacteraceae bacterium]
TILHFRWVRRGNYRDKEEWWTPRVSYRYEVNGRTYTSNTISGYDTSELTTHEYWDFSRRAENCRVVIHYNPEKPQESVVMPFRSHFTVWTHLIAGVFVGGIGGFVYLASYAPVRR